MFVVVETFTLLILRTGAAVCNSQRAEGKLKKRYREQSSTLIKCQTGLLEKQRCSIIPGWQEWRQESSAKWCTSHSDTGRASRRAAAKAGVVKGAWRRALAVMRLMIRLESLLLWRICKAVLFPSAHSGSIRQVPISSSGEASRITRPAPAELFFLFSSASVTLQSLSALR